MEWCQCELKTCRRRELRGGTDISEEPLPTRSSNWSGPPWQTVGCALHVGLVSSTQDEAPAKQKSTSPMKIHPGLGRGDRVQCQTESQRSTSTAKEARLLAHRPPAPAGEPRPSPASLERRGGATCVDPAETLRSPVGGLLTTATPRGAGSVTCVGCSCVERRRRLRNCRRRRADDTEPRGQGGAHRSTHWPQSDGSALPTSPRGAACSAHSAILTSATSLRAVVGRGEPPPHPTT